MTDQLIASVVPELLPSAELYDDPPGLEPLPEEEPLIAKSVAKRRNEFITVRYCARQALSVLGIPEAPILKGDKGQPLWPDGIVGSMTHTEGFRGRGGADGRGAFGGHRRRTARCVAQWRAQVDCPARRA